MKLMLHFGHDLSLRLLIVLIAYGIAILVESVYPADDSPNEKGLALNWLHTIVFHIADLTLGAAVVYYISVLIRGLHYRAPIHIPQDSAISTVVLCVFAIAMSDFFYYWFHRLQHWSKWLWAEHELHHSDEHVNITTNSRHHWLETVLQPLFLGLPLTLLFDPPAGTLLSLVLAARAISYMNHLNARIRYGWFSRVLANPQNHRIHHSKMPEHIDKNFATIVPLWDILFGTYYHPKSDEWPSTGVEGVKIESLWQAIIAPFSQWQRMISPSNNDDHAQINKAS